MSSKGKFERFWDANSSSGYVVELVRKRFGRFGEFSVDNADVLLFLRDVENVDPGSGAVTWLDETTFRFISESNPNRKSNPNDDFKLYDVGPFQVNVGLLYADLANRFVSAKGLDVARITGTKAPLFNGDPVENARMGARKLNRTGRAVIVSGPPEKRVELYPALDEASWNALSDEEKSKRRCVAYTGPEARETRARHWEQFYYPFREFFKVYGAEE